MNRQQKIQLLKQIQAGLIDAAELQPAQVHICYELTPGEFSIPGTDKLINRMQFNKLCDAIGRPQDKIILYRIQPGNGPLED